MKQIFHHYELWEDYKYDFYNNISGSEKEIKLKQVTEMFNSKELTKEMMFKVVNEWKYSCEHNLTNEGMNKIAYIGQAACALYKNIPNTITMQGWHLVTKEVQERSNSIAEEALKYWEEKITKTNQLCLNLD